MKSPAIVLTLSLAFAIAACDLSLEPNLEGPRAFHHSRNTDKATSQQSRAIRTFDDRLLSVAQQVSRFGGIFLDRDGVLNIYIKDFAAQPDDVRDKLRNETVAALQDEFGSHLQDAGGVESLNNVKILDARYDFSELKEWYDAAIVVWEVSGVVYSDIQEKDNQLLFGVESELARRGVFQVLTELGIPHDATIVELGEMHADAATNLTHTELTDKVRPVVGGVRTVSVPNSRICSVAFNVYSSSTDFGSVTASHCTPAPGETEYGDFAQPDPGENFAIEWYDPPYFTGGSCPSGYKCRYSDSVLLHVGSFDTDWVLGKIARTIPPPATSGPGSKHISDIYPDFTIVGSATPMLGAAIEKMGQSTGWTAGLVQNTCFTSARFSGLAYLCQLKADAYTDEGDSGGPVFKRVSGANDETDVDIYGVTSGLDTSNNLVFSSYYHVSNELTAIAY